MIRAERREPPVLRIETPTHIVARRELTLRGSEESKKEAGRRNAHRPLPVVLWNRLPDSF